jgi:hypothetical protein
MKQFEKKTPGTRLGTSDGPAPEFSTDAKLSRLHDAIRNAQLAGLDGQAVFMLAPVEMRLEFNYARWTYVA